VTPWILLHAANYAGYGSAPKISVPPGVDDALHLLSIRTLFYGATFLDYTSLALVTVSVAAMALLAWRSEHEPAKRAACLGILAGALSGAVCYFVSVAGLKDAVGDAQSLRLAIPFLLGPCVTSIVLSPALRQSRERNRFFYWPLFASLAISAAFLPSMVGRYRQAVRFGSILAFSDLARSPAYINYTAFCISGPAGQYILALQNKVPAGEPLLAWINTPFLLDYKRNPIVDADTAGLASPWARVPPNVRYILWQYAGPEVRMTGDYSRVIHGPGYRERIVAARSLNFANLLSQTAQKSQVIASDGEFVLFKIAQAL
jgi:hypothetical protein